MVMSLSQGWCFKSGGRCTESARFKPKQVFAAFPFEEEYFWLFDNVVKPVVEGLKGKTGRYNLKVIDARSQNRTRDYMCWIAEEIRSSHFCIADLSVQNVNVYSELSMFLGLSLGDHRRRFVPISSFQERLASDIASVNVVRYRPDNIDEFAQRLEATCLETFKAAAPSPASVPTSSPAPVTRSDPMPAPPLFLPYTDDYLRNKEPFPGDLLRFLPPSGLTRQ